MARVRHYLRSYLDEYAKEDVQEAKIQALHVPFRKGVHVFGFLADEVLLRTDHPSHYSLTSESLDVLDDVWASRADHRHIKAHHYVFAIPPAMGESLRKRGIPADAFLLSSIIHCFLSHQERFRAGSRYGYAVGIHHDRAHIHGHVLLHSVTSNGEEMKLSTDQGIEAHDDDAFHWFRTVFQRLCEQTMQRMELVDNRPGPLEGSGYQLIGIKALQDAATMLEDAGPRRSEWDSFAVAAELYETRITEEPRKAFQEAKESAEKNPPADIADAPAELNRMVKRIRALHALRQPCKKLRYEVLEEFRSGPSDRLRIDNKDPWKSYELAPSGTDLIEVDRLRQESAYARAADRESQLDLVKRLRREIKTRHHALKMMRTLIPGAAAGLQDWTAGIGKRQPIPGYLLSAEVAEKTWTVPPAAADQDKVKQAVAAMERSNAEDFAPADAKPGDATCPLATVRTSIPYLAL